MASNVLYRDRRPRWHAPTLAIFLFLGASVVAAETATRPNPRAIRINANIYDQFWIYGTANGNVAVRAIIDTGAADNFITKPIAKQLGLKNLKYTDRHLTANGETMDAPTHLNTFEAAGVTMPNFSVEVAGGKNETNMLGMPWLKNFDVSISKGVMILTPKDK
jgi:clan AA aspartic protease (TIGR02281 family)